MNTQSKKMELLGSASIPKALLSMGIPTMIGMLVNAFYNLVDAYFVGGLGESQMGAISVVYPLGQVVVGLGLLFGNGAASYISRLLGRGDKENANKVASTALYSSVSVGAVIIIISMVFLHPILKLLGATDSILPFAATYASIYIVSCIFNVFNVTMNNLVTSEGAAKTTMCALLTGAVLNIALDPLFIYVFDLGVAGAAIATAISQVVSTFVYLTYIFRKKSVFHFRVKDCTYTKENMSEIFKIGIPTLVFQILTSVSISLINNAAGDYGDSAIAGMGVVTRLISMGSLSVFGFIKGFQPIAGYSYGAKKFNRLREAIKTSILWSTVICVIFGVILALFPAAIVSRFTKGDAEMIRIGAASLRANGISIMLFGFYTVYSSLFLALGKGREGFILGACRQGICFIPVILLLPIVWGLNGIMYAQPIADMLSAVITVFMAIPLHKKLNEMQKQTAAISTNDNN
ncbi:MATE family efflux transporter [Schaedlerella arabinosiphila]|uniref:Multidrug export protein MepA n=1 Tax=Schaedlerella arabinosiphila TaxID=2044587 RepID=A0A9X5H5F2_9FIRM|nr:MATE family efflux transporter [Schaedlerella arabinosiphila]KAI4444852.1 Multidrug export protein MepA [Schaedlerella arabinosiphila]NDO69922.1 MATE family efflux transporter [Schaedlerella arabinosiphila]